MKKIILVILLLLSTNVFASEYMFNVLEPFGSLNGFLAGFIVIMQYIIIYVTGISIIYSALEMVSNPDIPKLLINFIGSAFKIILVLEFPKIIVSVVNGFSAGGKTVTNNFGSATSQISALAGSRGFKALIDFLSAINIAVIIVFLALAILVFMWSAMNYVTNQDISGLIKHFIIGFLFIMLALALNDMSMLSLKTRIDGTEIPLKSIDIIKVSTI